MRHPVGHDVERDPLTGAGAHEQWERCFRYTSRGIAIGDASTNVIERVNPAFAAMHRGRPEDFAGMHVGELFAAGDREAALRRIRGNDAHTSLRFETEHLRLDGTSFPVRVELIAAARAPDDGGYRIAWVDDLTAQRAAERDRHEAQHLFETAFADAPIGMALVGLDGSWLKVNRALCQIVGWSEAELLATGFQDITHPDDLAADLARVEALLRGDSDGYEMDKRYIRRDGRTIWITLSVTLVRDPSGAPRHFISQIQDITAAREAQDALARSEARLKAIFEHVPAAMALRDVEGRYEHVNAHVARALGREPAEIVGLSAAELFPELADEVRTQDERLLADGEPLAEDMAVPQGDGSTLDFHVVRYPVRDSEGAIAGLGSFSVDITQRKRIERELHQQRHALAEAQRIARLGSWSWDSVADTATWSAEMYRIFGRDPELGPATSEQFFAYVHPDHRERLAAGYARTFGGGPSFELDYRIVRSDGVERTLHALGRHDAEHPGNYVGTVQDVTELREAERALRRERDHTSAILAAMDEGYALSSNGIIQAVNAQLCRLTGFTEAELVGATAPMPFWPPELHDEMTRLRSEAIAQRGGTFDLVLMRKNGERFEAQVTAQAALDPDGELVGFVSTIRDVSVLRRQQRELERLARTDSLTGLANRRVLQEALLHERALAARSGEPLALILIDIDRFKDINDRHGHPAGDAVLTEVAHRLGATTRSGELLARVGGEEFAWVLPRTTVEGALNVAERARRAISAEPFAGVGHVTISAGVSALTGSACEHEQLYRLADRALYEAKRGGRNRVVVAADGKP